jgi:hypothetical protein
LASEKIKAKILFMTIQNLTKKQIKMPNYNLAKKNKAAILLLDSWLNDDEKEQKETFEYLKKKLDEDRLSDRKLFE